MTPHHAASLALLSATVLAMLGACNRDSTGLTSNPSTRVAIGDTVTATIQTGGEPHTFTFDARPGDSLALFLHAASGSVSLTVMGPDASTLATLGDTGRPGALEERGAPPFAVRVEGTHVVRAAALGSSATSFRFILWRTANGPERRPVTIVIGDTVRGESLETPADVDEFTVQGQEGDELIAYVRALAPHPLAVISLDITRTGADPFWGGVASVMSDTAAAELEARPTGRFILPATGEYKVRVEIYGRRWGGTAGQVAGYPRGYELQLRRIVRAPERVPATITPGDTLAVEAIDYVGDIDELTIATVPGGEYNVFLERPGEGRRSLSVRVVGLTEPWAEPAAMVNTPGLPLQATATGSFNVGTGATGRIQVAADANAGAYKGPYRAFVYPLNRSPEVADASLVLGDTVAGEAIELAGDVDEFTLTVPDTTLANFAIWRDGTETSDLVRLQLIRDAGGQVAMTEAYRGTPGEKTGKGTGTFSLPEGTYQLRISGSDSRGFGYRGPYRVQTHVIDPAPESGPTAISFGDTVLGVVEPLGDIDTYRFTARVMQHVNVRPESVGGEPLPSTYALVRHVRTGVPLSPRWYGGTQLPRFDIPEDGEYTIEYAGSNGGRVVSERGPYRLVLDTVSTAPEQHGTLVSPGDSVTGESLDFFGDIDVFVLSGAPGEELLITFAAPGSFVDLDLLDLDTRLRIDGTTSSGSVTNTGRFRLPESGRLAMRVWERESWQFGGITGLYRIAVSRIDRRPENVAAQVDIDSIVEGEAIDPDGDVDEFTFNGVGGDTVNVYFQTPLGTCCFDGLVLELVNPATGAILGSVRSANSTQRLDEQGTGPVELPSSGTYMVRVRGGLDWLGRGQYRLQVKKLA
ncbi:MAG TPA: hypothetical protein VFU01_02135 [Gemmatimonadaceae bacterium]|nr:hypothetical protein [Gemmatimonadaceae bacterium]